MLASRTGGIVLVAVGLLLFSSCTSPGDRLLGPPDRPTLSVDCAGGGEYCRELTGSEENEVEEGIDEIRSWQSPCPDIQSDLYGQLSGGDITAYDDDDGYEAWATIGGNEISINANMISGSVGSEDLAIMLVHEARHNANEDHPDPGTFSDNDALSYTCVGIT